MNSLYVQKVQYEHNCNVGGFLKYCSHMSWESNAILWNKNRDKFYRKVKTGMQEKGIVEIINEKPSSRDKP